MKVALVPKAKRRHTPSLFSKGAIAIKPHQWAWEWTHVPSEQQGWDGSKRTGQSVPFHGHKHSHRFFITETDFDTGNRFTASITAQTTVPHCQEGKITYPYLLSGWKPIGTPVYLCHKSPASSKEQWHQIFNSLASSRGNPGKSVYPTGAKHYRSPLLPECLQPFPDLLQHKPTFSVTTKLSLPSPSSASPPHKSVVTWPNSPLYRLSFWEDPLEVTSASPGPQCLCSLRAKSSS